MPRFSVSRGGLIAVIVVNSIEGFERGANQIRQRTPKPPKRRYKENHRMTGIEIRNLRLMVEKALGDNCDFFDFEAEIDWDRGYWDNKDILAKKLNAATPGRIKYSEGYNDDLDEQCRAYYEAQTYGKDEQVYQEPHKEAIPTSSIQVTSPQAVTVKPSVSWLEPRFKKVYLPAASREWLPVWIRDATKRAITIQVTARLSGSY